MILSHASQTNQDNVAELYIGFFGRAPDATGFECWAEALANGATPYQIAAAFAMTPEFEAAYSGLTVTEQVAKLYFNVLNRAPDPSALAYWVGQINSGQQTFPDVVFNLTNSAFEQVGTQDGLLVQNKVQVAEFFATNLRSNDTAIAQTAFNNVTSKGTSAIAAEATLSAAVNPGAVLTLTAGLTGTGSAIVGDVQGNGVQLVLAAAAGTNYGNVEETLADTSGLQLHSSKITFANTSQTAVADTLESFTSTHMESVNIISGGVAADGIANALITYIDDLDRTVQINISGDKDFTLGQFIGNASATSLIPLTLPAGLQTIDGSMATGKLIITAGSDTSIEGSRVTTTYDNLQIIVGSGGSQITNDAVGGIVNGGSGDDFIYLNGNSAYATTGAGLDTVWFGALNQSADLSGLGTDTVVVGRGATLSLRLSELTTLTNAAAGDVIDLRAVNASSSVVDVTLQVVPAPDLAAALVLAANAIGAGNTGYFNFADDTYLVANDAQTLLDTGDAVVKIVGVHADFEVGPANGEVTVA
jgi:hypothetical protein